MGNPEPAEKAPAEVEAYCVKCKALRLMTKPQLVTTRNGRLAARGRCPVCGATMMKFLASK